MTTPECSCAMTEGSQRRCPLHGEDTALDLPEIEIDWQAKFEKQVAASVVAADRWKRTRASMQAEADDAARELALLRPAVKAAEKARDEAQKTREVIEYNAKQRIKLLTDRLEEIKAENETLRTVVAEGRVAFMRELGEKLFGFIGTES